MKCKHAKKLFSLYIDEHLVRKDREELEQHLSVCSGCMEEYEKMKSIELLLQKAEQRDANPFLWTKIKTAIEATRTRPSVLELVIPFLKRKTLIFAGIFALLIMLIGFEKLTEKWIRNDILSASPEPFLQDISFSNNQEALQSRDSFFLDILVTPNGE